MKGIDTHFLEIGFMDRLSAQDTPLRRLDPRAKLLTTLLFVATVVSFGKYEISGLLPFTVYPVALAVLGNIPAAYLLRKILIVAPFAVLFGVFNPCLDRAPMIALGGLTLSGGWVSLLSILIRFALTVGAALILLAGTGIHGICRALEGLGTPRVFAVQLLFLHRYLFVLVDEGTRMVRARAARSFGSRGMGVAVYGHMLGSLLVRALDRAQRIHLAMTCRGFDGSVRGLDTPRLKAADAVFLLGWSGLFAAMRLVNVSRFLGARLVEAAG